MIWIAIFGGVVIIVIVGMLLAGEVDYHVPSHTRGRNLDEP
jgi:hypothetical protein